MRARVRVCVCVCVCQCNAIFEQVMEERAVMVTSVELVRVMRIRRVGTMQVEAKKMKRREINKTSLRRRKLNGPNLAQVRMFIGFHSSTRTCISVTISKFQLRHRL